MGNANYIRGVKMEREIVNYEKGLGHSASRHAGSHGVYDLCSFDNESVVLLVQVKVHKSSEKKLPVIIRKTIPGTIILEERHFYKR